MVSKAMQSGGKELPRPLGTNYIHRATNLRARRTGSPIIRQRAAPSPNEAAPEKLLSYLHYRSANTLQPDKTKTDFPHHSCTPKFNPFSPGIEKHNNH